MRDIARPFEKLLDKPGSHRMQFLKIKDLRCLSNRTFKIIIIPTNLSKSLLVTAYSYQLECILGNMFKSGCLAITS